MASEVDNLLATWARQAQSAVTPAPVAIPRGTAGPQLPVVDLSGKPPRLLPSLPTPPALPALPTVGGPAATLTAFTADGFVQKMQDGLMNKAIAATAAAAGVDPIEVGGWQRVGVLAGGITVGTLSILAGIAIMAK